MKRALPRTSATAGEKGVPATMIHSYAMLSPRDYGFCRFFGHGLGNVLFPWVRSILTARRDGLTEVFPTWRQWFQQSGPRSWLRETLRGRGLWRGTRDYRRLFRPVPGEIVSPWHRLALLRGGRPLLSEAGYERRRRRGEGIADETTVVFRGMRQRFWDVRGEHEFLRAELLRRSRPSASVRAALAFDFRRSITVHVRLGDFTDRGSLGEIRRLQINGRLPMDWYREKISQLRAGVGETWPVYLFSDGRDDELSDLLALPECHRLAFGDAWSDLLAMANASVMLCSLSTLNAWSCFLGRPPAVHLRGVHHTPLYYEQPAAEVQSDLGEALPESFLAEARRRSTQAPRLVAPAEFALPEFRL
jgi:hypothetical protein